VIVHGGKFQYPEYYKSKHIRMKVHSGMRSIATLVVPVGTAMSLAIAPLAAADTGEYLHRLQPFYTDLSAEELLSEGTRVCDALRSGMYSPQAVIMVQRDLEVSLSAAGDIVAAAAVHLGC
jgi:hypothetical protein